MYVYKYIYITYVISIETKKIIEEWGRQPLKQYKKVKNIQRGGSPSHGRNAKLAKKMCSLDLVCSHIKLAAVAVSFEGQTLG